ncbi:bromodomain adjacent to zinc finger domain protein 2A [Etheostoma spectabile]|uniref:bromodomain adjacent to zinc finger domain protein 2A n=1 Tax=Etheostoma spectabile TaxID=54343 RepID=UPI0013AF8684|nr:bromodomain adjacent to zinc finger domain protein 2A [Etheostoma spectabile]XP_032377633.1 bromodomain adjacent to zinc finger domain protein 2A [Etheostoma spectabile]XP_032377634.1 bromodomain adjacent to zinc finger domain protein 2A [Etheostoma spectabile]XP_032377635.1 bromodomain adjacent to zinc finger domain protein 2A [Etheostoma spectabile]XP_032377636.1 bromodomain adjacent to zinc finger domain protein 2A [Etheostoma spectabile]
MESNNHFNYGTHSSQNSGLKLSSGDSLYTNGSSMSFPQQGKNMNGEMNVNGVTTVLGSGVPGSHPPTAPYPHMSNHHQSNMAYDYLWGGHPQYGPAMGTSPGHGLHQKQPTPGIVQPQSQHHFQGHGQYQLNGGVESSHQPPGTGPPNMPLTGSQYWSRSNPSPQQMSYNSPSMYGTYQSQAHPGITPSQHHQQQSLQPPPHQPSQQHIHSHRHPHHHHHQQHQQPQHYGMMPNGMPYYQHQPQHPSLPSPQQQPSQQSQPQGQAQMMPTAAQNFTPPRGSPQPHSLGKGGTGSPLPVGMSSTPLMSPSTAQDSGSPKGHSRERSPHASNVGISTVMQGHTREAVKEVDTSYNGMERAPVAYRLPKSAAHEGPDYRQHSEQPAAQRPEMASSVRETAVHTPPLSVSSQLSESTQASTPPRVSTAPAVSESATTAPGPPIVSSPDVESTPPQISMPPNVSSAPSPAAPPRLSSPPLMKQGLRPPISAVTETSPAGSKHLSVGPSSSSLSASPKQLSTPLASIDSVSRPAAVSSDPPVSPSSSSESVGKSGPPKLIPAASSVGAKSSSAAVAPPLMSASGSSTSAPPGSCLSIPASPMSLSKSPSVGCRPCDPAPKPQHQANTSPAADSGLSTASAAVSPPGAVNLPSPAAHESLTVRPLSTLPLLTTQASRTAPVSAPPALVSVPSAMGTSSGVVQSCDSGQHLPNTTPPHVLKQLSPRAEHHSHNEDRQTLANKRNGKPEEHISQLDKGTIRTPQKVGASENNASEICSPKSLTDLPGKSLQTTVAPDQKPKNKPPASEKHHMQSSICEAVDSLVEQTPLRKSSHFHSTRIEHLTNEDFDNSLHAASHFDGNSTFNSPSRIDVSSVFEKTSLLDADSLCVDDSTHFDSSFHLRKDTSQFDSTSHADDEPSTAFDTTRDSSYFVEDSRDDTLDSSREEETSEAEETKDGFQITGESMLESSLNNTSQMEEPSVHSSDLSNSHSFVSSQPGSQGPEAEWGPRGHDTPDSAGRISIKTTVNETLTPPSFKMRDENFIAFSTPAEGPAVHPLQPVTEPIVTAAGGPQKTPGKPRKPRDPKTIWIKTPVPEKAQRKPRVRTPKVDKMKTDEEGGNKEEVAKGRKRKKSLKVEVKDASSPCGEAGPPAGEVDSITATIEAVLANVSANHAAVEKPKKAKRVKKQDQGGNGAKTSKQDAETTAADVDENDDDDSSTAGESNRQRRVATEEQVQVPMRHGWKREIRVKKMENRMKGETWYYTPCGRRMKQFPEIIKYLKRHTDSVVSREHFSFSPRMPVGDFYEEKETPEGKQWVLLANEEVPSMIMAITGRRGRPPNPDKEKPCRVRGPKGGQARRPGRPPKPKIVDLLSKVDAKLLKQLEAKEALTEEEKEKLAKIKKKMKKKARMKKREDTKIKKMKAEKKRAKLEQVKDQELKADPAAPQATKAAPRSAAEPKKPGRRRSVKVEAPPAVQQTDEERIAQGKRVLGARSKAKALAKAQAEAEAAAQAAYAAKRAAERRVQAQRRLEERKRQQLIAEELKKPTEDMCLTDHKPLPELSHIPGVVLSGKAFAHCLTVVEFLHGYGKMIGLNIPKDVPSLATLQEGLLGLGDSQGEVQNLLIKLVEAALHDPGLPSFYQSVKILGEKLVESELTRSTVSEVLRVFLESHDYDTDVCNTLRTKTFHALPPDTKAAILGFLVDELNSSNVVTSDIDNTLENMATYRKNKWIIEGKLRKLKAALGRRTGRSEEELCFEERRRSARVADEENLSMEESGLVSERSNRRARKEEPKLSDSESPSSASIPELERQIDKLAKRQAFFRKKLLQSSHSMRAVLLGQDRYQRRYLALPHLGGVLVEGPEELLTSGEVLVAEVPVTFLKKEPKVEEVAMPTTPPPTLPTSFSSATSAQTPTSSPEEDPLPGTASLMSRPRGRGRPRKIKLEVELHLRTAKIRRRRRSSARSGGEEGPGSQNGGTLDLTQTAFKSWLSQSQEAVTNGTCSAAGDAPEGNRPEGSVKEIAEKQGQWFNLLPKQPCDDNSLTEPQIPSSPPKLLPQILSALPALTSPLVQPDPLLPDLTPADPVTATTQQGIASAVPVCAPVPPPPQLLPAAIPPATSTPITPPRPGRRRRRGSRGSSPARRGPRGAAAKRRGRPPNSVFQELEQQYFTQLVVKPIPASMVRGWWWIKDPEELYSTLQALHPRGIRERVLHKHLAKHMESLAEMCTKPIDDPIFKSKVEEKDVLIEALQQPWQVQEKAMETDINALRWVEDLEQRVIAADLHLKAAPQSALNDAESNTETPMAEFQPYTIPDPDSTRDDLQYYEHDADPRDDWIVRTKKEWSGLPRIATHPLDLAVLRLANLERNIERRYLKEPLWNPAEVMRLAPLTPTPGEEHPMDAISLESEITSRLRTWRQALDRCRSAPQVCLCLLQLEKAIAWERSVTKVTCQVCRKGDNDDCLLLCDGCDRGCHMYCLRPKITQVPEGDWFCPTCVAKDDCDSPRSSKKRTRVKKRRYEDDSSEDEMTTRRKSGSMATRYKETVTPPSSSRHSGEGSAAKRRRMTTRNQPDLTFCEIILMEMEAHADAWPFLEPVNPRLVPGYRRIIKSPMDFLTMRERLLQGGYCSCEEFAADAELVFNNCEQFNEDTSEVGMAGHAMRRFFESRWAEFYSNKDK